MQRRCPIVVRRRGPRRQFRRPAETVERRLQQPAGLIDDAQVEVRLGIIGKSGDRRFQHYFGLAGITRLKGGDGADFEKCWVFRRDPESLFAQCRRLAGPPILEAALRLRYGIFYLPLSGAHANHRPFARSLRAIIQNSAACRPGLIRPRRVNRSAYLYYG